MAPGGGNRNQKLAAKKAHRKAVVAGKKKAEGLGPSLSTRVAAASKCVMERCFRTRDMFEAGIGYVVVVRRLPSGTKGCAFFLVDLFCLGAKDAFYREMAPSDLDDHIERLGQSGQDVVDIDPASACKLVTGAVAFAAGFGIAPVKDYRAVAGIFGDIDPAASPEDFTFGQSGKPLYIPGPNDSPTRMREIQRSLANHLGSEGTDLGFLITPSLLQQDLGTFGLRQDDASLDEEPDGLIIEHEGSTEHKDPLPDS